MLPGLYDIYVLSDERSALVLDRFLSRFAPHHELAAEDFAVQDDSERVFDCLVTAISYCVVHPCASASFYWNCHLSSSGSAMAFFTKDGGLILGLSASEIEASKAFADLRAFVGGVAPGYICFEQCPPDTITEFLANVQRYRIT